MPNLKADLHIHSCLSTCGSLDNSPQEIISRAKEIGLDVIGIADHNCTFNAETLFNIAKQKGIIVLPGIEITSSEEAHLLAFFDSPQKAKKFGQIIFDSLPDIENQPEKTGDQVICDEDENIEFVDKYLLNASKFSFDKLFTMIKDYGGVFIPAHIDRASFSIVIQLGFLPPMRYDCVEITKAESANQYSEYNHIANSDAHYLEDIGKRYSIIEAEEATPESILKAIREGKITPVFSPITNLK
ncbi:MAG: PHP domain-containing protein [Spirochaetales bacterium]|nr:PHP domain-containing protein [Spirochaetales bacterium]